MDHSILYGGNDCDFGNDVADGTCSQYRYCGSRSSTSAATAATAAAKATFATEATFSAEAAFTAVSAEATFATEAAIAAEATFSAETAVTTEAAFASEAAFTTTASNQAVIEFMKSTMKMPLWKRLGLSAVSLAVFAQIGWCNLPDETVHRWMDRVEKSDSDTGYRFRVVDWMIRYAAYCIGLNGKWQMYGGQSRFNWSYNITGIYVDSNTGESTERVLPLPRQTERTLIQRYWLDFKEAKFLLNIYSDELARETYSRYLAREFASHDGKPIANIRYTLVTQQILPPLIAVREQQVLETRVETMVVNEFDVKMENPSQTIAKTQ